MDILKIDCLLLENGYHQVRRHENINLWQKIKDEKNFIAVPDEVELNGVISMFESPPEANLIDVMEDHGVKLVITTVFELLTVITMLRCNNP